MKWNRKDRTKAHRNLKGLKASWTNASVDFVISQNTWSVVFEDEEGRTVDPVDEFLLNLVSLRETNVTSTGVLIRT